MATKVKEEAPEVAPVETKAEAEFWSKGAKYRLGDLAQFKPFTPGINNMGKFVDRPNLLSRARDEDEYLLYRGWFKTSDPDLIANLKARSNPAFRFHAETQVPV